MAALGIGMMIGGGAFGSGGVAVVIEDYMWQGYSNGGTAGELTPLPTTYDFNDTWDLDVNAFKSSGSLDYMPQAVGDISDEGYWDLDDNDDVQPEMTAL